MHLYKLRAEMLIERPLSEVFSFFENPSNLGKITPRWVDFKITSEEPIKMRKGAEIYYTIKVMNVPMHWKTVITDYQPPLLFVDEQEKGPYAFWHHRHTFEETARGVMVGDHVQYAMPLGPLGRLAHGVMVSKQLRSIFSFRQNELGKIFGGKTVELIKPIITR